MADNYLKTKVAHEEYVTITVAEDAVRVNTGIGYVFAGIIKLFRDFALLFTRRKTKSGATRVTKSGAIRISQRQAL